MRKNILNIETLHTLLDYSLTANSTSGKGRVGVNTIETRLVLITPQLAKALLKRNLTNRPITRINVETLKREMNSGNWLFDGEPIRFNINGLLSDGQHRLTAIIETGRSYQFNVTSGLPVSVFKVMDTGRRRTGSDAMAIENIPNSKTASAMTKFIFGFKNGLFSENRNSNRTLSNTELLRYYGSLRSDVQKSVLFGKTNSTVSGKLLSPTQFGGMHYLLSTVNASKATEFLSNLATGANLYPGSPIKVLRDKLVKAKYDEHYNITSLQTIKFITYLWYKFIRDEEVHALRIPADFPVTVSDGTTFKSKIKKPRRKKVQIELELDSE